MGKQGVFFNIPCFVFQKFSLYHDSGRVCFRSPALLLLLVCIFYILATPLSTAAFLTASATASFTLLSNAAGSI